jgi:hypothetical protein
MSPAASPSRAQEPPASSWDVFAIDTSVREAIATLPVSFRRLRSAVLSFRCLPDGESKGSPAFENGGTTCLGVNEASPSRRFSPFARATIGETELPFANGHPLRGMCDSRGAATRLGNFRSAWRRVRATRAEPNQPNHKIPRE